jgi:hypothetical protein
MYVNFSKFFRGRAGHGGKENFRHVAERGGENSLCGGDPQRPKYVAEISHGGKNRCGGNSPWRKKIVIAEYRHGGKKFPWRKIFSVFGRVQSVHFSSYSRSEMTRTMLWKSISF